MATNEKTIYAAGWTTYGGKMYRPGEQLSGRMPDGAVQSAIEGGVTTDSHARAQEAARGEAERVRDVQHQIETRSEKRAKNE